MTLLLLIEVSDNIIYLLKNLANLYVIQSIDKHAYTIA